MFFLELSCFFHDPGDVGNLIFGSSAFSKTSLNIRKFTVHILLKPGLENFKHYFSSVWDECNCVVVWAFLALPFFGIGMKTYLFQSCGNCWVFQICWHITPQFKSINSFALSFLYCQQIWKTHQWPQDCKRSVFIPIPKKGNAKEWSNYHTPSLWHPGC